MKATPPSQLHLGPNGSEIFEGYNKKGEWYRIVHGGGGGWASDEVRRRPVEAAADGPRQDNASSYSTV
jgi:hypothetical protein